MSEVDGQNAQATEQTSMADIAGSIQVPDNSEASGASTASDGEQQFTGTQKEMADFIASQKKQMDDIVGTAEKVVGEARQITEREQQKVLNEAVDNAVAKINDGVGGNDKLADTFLNTAYRNDPNFQKVFDNRIANPDAYENALGILRDEWKAVNENRIDPQIAENQRALTESQRSGSTVQASDENARLDKLSDGEFMREMRKIAQSN